MRGSEKSNSAERLDEDLHLLQAVRQKGHVGRGHLLAEGDQLLHDGAHVLRVAEASEAYEDPAEGIRVEEEKLLEDHGLLLGDVEDRRDLVLATPQPVWPYSHHSTMALHTLRHGVLYHSHHTSSPLVLVIDASCSFSSPRSFSTTCFFAPMSITPYCSRIVEMIFASHAHHALTPTWFTCNSRGWRIITARGFSSCRLTITASHEYITDSSHCDGLRLSSHTCTHFCCQTVSMLAKLCTPHLLHSRFMRITLPNS